MGRQIRFWAVQEDLDSFFDTVKENGGIVINENGKALSVEDLAHITDQEYMRKRFAYASYFVRFRKSKIKYHYYRRIKRKCLDDSVSEVIQMDVCASVPNHPDWINGGRLWYQSKYYKKNTLVEKSGELTRLYDSLKKYITKQFTITPDKMWYVAPRCQALHDAGKLVFCIGSRPVNIKSRNGAACPPENMTETTGQAASPCQKSARDE